MADALVAKPFLSIIQDMIAYARATNTQITDYNIGSVARTLLESPAIEIDALHQEYIAGLLDAIPTAIYQGFGFTPLSAQAASGTVTFTTPTVPSSPIIIPQTVTVRDPLGTVTYALQTSATITSLTATVSIAATSTGEAGNAIADTLTAYSPAIADVSVNNPEAVLGGADVETADQQRQRFSRYIQSLARGTVASLEYIALTGEVLSVDGLVMERAARVKVSETAGRVNLYVYNGVGNTTQTLLDDIALKIEGYWDAVNGRWIAGYRPAGMRVDVNAFTEVPFAVSVEVDADPVDQTAALEAQITAALDAVLSADHVNNTLRPADIINAVISLEGVNGCVLLSPTTATIVPANTIYRIGQLLTLTWV